MDEAPTLDLNVAFKFFFADPQWLQKAAIGGLLALTIIGSPAVLGWCLLIQRRAANGEEAILPEWDDLVDYWVLGLKSMASGLVWSLPTWIILIPVLLFFTPVMNGLFSVDPNADFSPVPAIFWGFGLQVFSLLGTAYILFTLPIYTGLLLESGSFSGSLNVGRGLRLLRVNWLQFAGVLLVGYSAYYASYFAGLAMFCIGVFFTYPIGWAIMSNLFGQSYRIAVAKLDAAA